MMRPRVHSARALVWGLVVSLLCTGAVAAPPVQLPTSTVQPPMPLSVVTDILKQGRDLESQRRWSEAFALYEEAARRNPGQPDLERRLDLAKLHYDLSRRYSDASFRDSVSTLEESQALELFTDAATKMQSHFVQGIDWPRLLARGTAGLELALSDSSFIEHNLGNVSQERVNVLLREIRRTLSQRQIRNRNEARDAVAAVARVAQLHVRLQPAATIMEYTAGMLGGLDEYSGFLTSGQLNDLYSQIEGNFVGLGVELKAADGALLIVNVIRESPAYHAGILRGDRIIQVGTRTTVDLTTDQAADLLQGVEGSNVELTVVTGQEQPRRLVVARRHVDVPSVDDVKMVEPESGIAYLKMTCFQKNTAQDLDTALWDLHRQGMRSLIIDLRGNPGGLLTASVEVADRFIEEGSIVSTRGRSLGEDFNYTAHREGTWRVPLVVLIDHDSASASEILAGALRDHRRATIVGVRSYGKGSVQGIFPLSIGGTGVRITTAKFYSPAGKPFSRVGVEPEIVVHSAAKPIGSRLTMPVSVGEPGEDAIFNAGMNAARRQVAQR